MKHKKRLENIEHNCRNALIGANSEILRIMIVLRKPDVEAALASLLRLSKHFERIEFALQKDDGDCQI